MPYRPVPKDAGESWRENLPNRCPHVLDLERNPEQRPGLCIACRKNAGDPIARRMHYRRVNGTQWA